MPKCLPIWIRAFSSRPPSSCPLLICIAPAADPVRPLSSDRPSSSFTTLHHLCPSIHPPPTNSNMFSPERSPSSHHSSALIPLTIHTPRGKSRERVGSLRLCEETGRDPSRKNENINARTNTRTQALSRDPAHTRLAHNHPAEKNPAAETPTTIPFEYLIICRLFLRLRFQLFSCRKFIELAVCFMLVLPPPIR